MIALRPLIKHWYHMHYIIHCVLQVCYNLFCSSKLPQARTRWVRLTLSSLCPLSYAVNFICCLFLVILRHIKKNQYFFCLKSSKSFDRKKSQNFKYWAIKIFVGRKIWMEISWPLLNPGSSPRPGSFDSNHTSSPVISSNQFQPR